MDFDTQNENARLREVKTGSEEIFDGVILHVQRDTVRLPNGNETVREVIRHIGAVCVIPVLENGDVIMERQYRYPLDRKTGSPPSSGSSARKPATPPTNGPRSAIFIPPRPTAMNSSPCTWPGSFAKATATWMPMSSWMSAPFP